MPGHSQDILSAHLEILVIGCPEYIEPQIPKGYACRGGSEGLLGGSALLSWPKVTRLSLEEVCRVIACITGRVGLRCDLCSGLNEGIGVGSQDLDLGWNRALLKGLLNTRDVARVSAFENVARCREPNIARLAESKLMIMKRMRICAYLIECAMLAHMSTSSCTLTQGSCTQGQSKESGRCSFRVLKCSMAMVAVDRRYS